MRALKLSGLPQAPMTPPATPAPAPAPRVARPAPGSGMPTMPNPAGHALADSIQATRMAGGSGRLGADPLAQKPRRRTCRRW